MVFSSLLRFMLEANQATLLGNYGLQLESGAPDNKLTSKLVSHTMACTAV